MTDTENKNVINFDLGMKRERIVEGVGQLFDTDDPQRFSDKIRVKKGSFMIALSYCHENLFGNRVLHGLQP